MNILIIQILRLGDGLQLLPIVKGLKELNPQSQISLLTSTAEAPIFECEPDISHVHVLKKEAIIQLIDPGSKAGILEALGLLKSDLEPVSSVKWDWVINFSHTYSSALLCTLMDAKYRSGCVMGKDRRYLTKEKWFSYSLASFAKRRYSNFNWVDINKNIAGLPGVPPMPTLSPSGNALDKASAFKQGFGKDKRIVGMHPGASGFHKRWPVEKFAELGKRLAENHGCQILIFGSSREKGVADQIEDRIGTNVISLAGKTDLGQLQAYLGICDLLISNDTGPMHLAAAVGTSVVSLFFSTHFIETGPYGAGHVAIHPDIECFPCQNTAECSHKECLNYISPETAESAVLHQLDIDTDRAAERLNKNSDAVRVFKSTFDPWGNMDWVPMDGRTMSFREFERLLLKTAWLYFSDIIKGDDKREPEYLLEVMERYNQGRVNENLENEIHKFRKKLEAFRLLIKNAQGICIEIQSELLSPEVDQKKAEPLGEKLTAMESEIAEFHSHSSIGFLGELLSVFLDNIPRTDSLDLASKTLSLYRDLSSLIDGIMGRSAVIEKGATS
jgi:lipopolysaccharide heptosyltransferase II